MLASAEASGQLPGDDGGVGLEPDQAVTGTRAIQSDPVDQGLPQLVNVEHLHVQQSLGTGPAQIPDMHRVKLRKRNVSDITRMHGVVVWKHRPTVIVQRIKPPLAERIDIPGQGFGHHETLVATLKNIPRVLLITANAHELMGMANRIIGRQKSPAQSRPGEIGEGLPLQIHRPQMRPQRTAAHDLQGPGQYQHRNKCAGIQCAGQ